MISNKHILIAFGVLLLGLAKLVFRLAGRDWPIRTQKIAQWITAGLIVASIWTLSFINPVRAWIDINVLGMRYEQAIQKRVVWKVISDPRISAVAKDQGRERVAQLIAAISNNGVLRLGVSDLDSLFGLQVYVVDRSQEVCDAGARGESKQLGDWEHLPEIPREVFDRYAAALERELFLELDTIREPIRTAEALQKFLEPRPRTTVADWTTGLDPDERNRLFGSPDAPFNCAQLRKFMHGLTELPPERRAVVLPLLVAPPGPR